jgi:hypothetical protein
MNYPINKRWTIGSKIFHAIGILADYQISETGNYRAIVYQISFRTHTVGYRTKKPAVPMCVPPAKGSLSFNSSFTLAGLSGDFSLFLPTALPLS